MKPEKLFNGKVTLWCGDCLDVMKGLADNSIDSCVTDPPYHLTSIVKRFGTTDAKAPKTYKTGAYGGGFDPGGTGTGAAFARMSRGFMGKTWDGGDIAFRPEVWAEVLRVVKPGGHLLSCGGTRTYHRMACAIEDAGFEVRDCIQWLYGAGFPKSHDVSKGIDRIMGCEDQRVITHYKGQGPRSMFDGGKPRPASLPASLPASQWEGWGTALKPAAEMIVLARKPLSEGTVAANVLKWGTGAINIGACRVVTSDGYTENRVTQGINQARTSYEHRRERRTFEPGSGRWPANVIHDGSDEVVEAFPHTKSGALNPYTEKHENRTSFGFDREKTFAQDANDGSAARFFYSAKAAENDRLLAKHPTVKPVSLMRYLVRLVTPPGGICLDPFAGTGTTGEAAFREGMRAVLIEREKEYQNYIRKRRIVNIRNSSAKPDEVHKQQTTLFDEE